jgi:DNA segregation ATPase FtsK/SpoIIIE, S-DNA-T family
MLEYAGHVRDGLLVLRDRFVVGLVEDNPDFKPMYRDHRVDVGLYGDDGATLVLAELQMAAGLFARTFDRIEPAQLERPIRYAFPVLSQRTLLWMGQHTVHEVEHHGGDIEANVALLG